MGEPLCSPSLKMLMLSESRIQRMTRITRNFNLDLWAMLRIVILRFIRRIQKAAINPGMRCPDLERGFVKTMKENG